MTGKIVVAYEHDPADVAPIHLAVTSNGAEPTEQDWRPVLRDTIDGQLVVWVRGQLAEGDTVWLRDQTGIRQARPW